MPASFLGGGCDRAVDGVQTQTRELSALSRRETLPRRQGDSQLAAQREKRLIRHGQGSEVLSTVGAASFESGAKSMSLGSDAAQDVVNPRS